MDDKKYTISGSLLAKFLSVVLLCALGAGIVYTGFSYIFLLQCDTDSGVSDYLDSSECVQQMQQLSREIVSNYIYSGTEYTQANYSLDITSMHYTLYEKQADGSYAKVDTNDTSSASYTSSSTFYFANIKDYGICYYRTEPTDLTESRIYKVDAAVTKPFTANDGFKANEELFTRLYGNRSGIQVGLPVLGCFFIAILVFLFCAVGHRKNSAEIHRTWVERIPFELMIGFSVLMDMISMSMMPNIADITNGFFGTAFNTTVYGFILALMLAGLCTLVTLTTLAVRIKSHTFWKSTFVGMLVIQLGKWLSMISLVPRTALIVGGVLLLEVILLSVHEVGMSLFLDAVIGAYLIYCAGETKKIEAAGRQLASGNLDYRIADTSRLSGVYKRHAEDLNSIGDGMKEAVNQQLKSERLKTELITNVSHDIKTPLTSVINYVDLLRKDHTPQQEQQYLEVLDRQSKRLKKLTEDVVEASKASSGNVEAQLIPVNVREILEQSIGEYQDRLSAGKLNVIMSVKGEPLYALADGRLLWRVMSNLLSNLCKYAMPDTRVYLNAERTDDHRISITLKNISCEPLNISEEELMQRFVRGDASRHTEGSGLGLSIAESLTRLMKGTFHITIDGDLFKAEIQLEETAPAAPVNPPSSDSSVDVHFDEHKDTQPEVQPAPSDPEPAKTEEVPPVKPEEPEKQPEPEQTDEVKTPEPQNSAEAEAEDTEPQTSIDTAESTEKPDDHQKSE